MSQKNSSRSGINIKDSTIKIAILGLLTALATVLAMFTIRPNPSIKISLTFIPVVIAAYIFGPVGSGLVAGLADIIGCIVKPAGMIYPPITATEIIVGVVFGLFLYQKRSFVRIAISSGITQLIISMFVTPLWLYFLYGFNYYVTVGARMPQIAIMLAIELISIPFILKSLDKINVQKYIHTNKRKTRSPKKSSAKKSK